MILDTNALSAAADREPAALEVVARAEHLAVPVIVLGEYRFGIAHSRRRSIYENWLQEWIAAVSVLDVDDETTHHYAAIGLELKGLGKPIPTNDLWIASLPPAFPAARKPGPPLRPGEGHSTHRLVIGVSRSEQQVLLGATL
jgi:tRNA(fMet)-specific endonuclease VapC